MIATPPPKINRFPQPPRDSREQSADYDSRLFTHSSGYGRGVPSGYSGTPLAKKLGIKADHRVATVDAPADFRELLVDVPDGVEFVSDLAEQSDVIVAFFTSKDDLETRLHKLGESAFPDRVIWLAWPKQTSGVATDLTGNVVREVVLRTQLVDVKVCAISDIWSGLKVVWRKEHRAR